LDRTKKELVVVSIAALFGLGLAWHYEAEWFAMFFAAEAVQRSA
jgi:hypothetical protein